MNRWYLSAAALMLGSLLMSAMGKDAQLSKATGAAATPPVARLGPPEAVTAAEASLFAITRTSASLGAPEPVTAAPSSLASSAPSPVAPSPVASNQVASSPAATSPAATTGGDCCGYCGYPTGRVWASAEYLLWWTKGDRLPPLLTTSPASTSFADAGVLGRPGTSVLFGDDRVNDDARSGGRFTLGAWLNCAQTTGVEGNFFFLAQESTDFAIASTGTPILARPFFNVQTGANDSLKIAYPGVVAGDFHARETSELWGADVYVRQNICCGCCYRVDLLGGYRFASLRENLTIAETEIATSPDDPLFGIPIFINESFGTRNNFHGGQLGVIAEYARCRTFVRLVGKVALGGNCRTVTINGSTRVDGFAPESGGLLALPSNIGRYRSSEFAVIPEMGITLGYQATDRLRLLVGYTFLYWTGVARPGEQIDLVVNTSQPPLGGALAGASRPAFVLHDSDFWAQGLSVGVEFRY